MFLSRNGTAVTMVPSQTTVLEEVVQLLSSPSAFWFLLVVGSIGRFGSLGPSLISATRAAAPHAIATFPPS